MREDIFGADETDEDNNTPPNKSDDIRATADKLENNEKPRSQPASGNAQPRPKI